MSALRASRQSSPVSRAKSFPEFGVNFNSGAAFKSLHELLFNACLKMTGLFVLQQRVNEITSGRITVLCRLRSEKASQAVGQLDFKSARSTRITFQAQLRDYPNDMAISFPSTARSSARL